MDFNSDDNGALLPLVEPSDSDFNVDENNIVKWFSEFDEDPVNNSKLEVLSKGYNSDENSPVCLDQDSVTANLVS